MPTKEEMIDQIWEKLNYVVDPEIGVPILELNLVEKLDVSDDGNVYTEVRMTTPVCPAMFAYQIAEDVRRSIMEVEGVKNVTVKIKDHYMADIINQNINSPEEQSKSYE
ncbi:MAG: iron-sulfur cluster assembly protein [Nitrososphaerota archaeon]